MRRWYYGWSMLGVLAITETLSYGILIYAFSVFVVPLEQAFGWSRATINGAITAAQLVAGLLAWPVGVVLDRYGARWMMTAGAVWAAVWLGAWGLVTEPWQHIVVWVMLGISMATTLYEPAFVVVAQWFERRRSTALTVLTFVAGFAIIIATPSTTWLIHTYSWQVATWVYAAVMLCVVAPLLAWWIRKTPADVGATVDGLPATTSQTVRAVPVGMVRDVLREQGFWVLVAAFLASTCALVVVLQTFVPLLIDRGYAPADAAWYAATAGVLALPSRLLFTPLGLYFSRYTLATVLCVMQGLALVALMLLPGLWGVWGCVVLFGLSFGAITPARAALFADRYGVSIYGALSGILALVLTLARAIMPVLVELQREQSGDYRSIYIWVGVLSAVGSLGIAVVPALSQSGHEASKQPHAD
jgi:MFS family permease